MDYHKSINSILSKILYISLDKKYTNVTFCTQSFSDNRFLLDVKLNDDVQISIKDFQVIEKQMEKIISGAYKISYTKICLDDLKQIFIDNKYLLYDLENNKEDLYLCELMGYQFIDFQNEITNTNKIKAFKLLSIGGSYWLGDCNNEQLVRIQGVGFDNKQEFDEYIKNYEEQLSRDHRNIAKSQELFTFDQLAGQGLPIWLPNGAVIRKEIRNFLSSLEFKHGFESVFSPILGNIELYKKSGHWDHYQDNMFPPIKIDDEELVLRPMTCPHHILIFKKKNYSYKQLPIRLCEESMLHRYEHSGGLSGFERVREMVLEDTHIFCTPDQIAQEVLNCYNIINEAYAGLGCKVFQIDLSLHDPNNFAKFHQDKQMWDKSENDLRQILLSNQINFVEKVGEAAFYGPKIDFQVKTALGKIVTMSTIQLDFLLPQKFDLTYKDQNNDQQPVIMIHLGIVGTYERLLSILLEQTKGILPLWLAPRQVVIIPINVSLHNEYAQNLNQLLLNANIRSSLDDRDERMNKKIREAQINKVPYQIIIGDDEVNHKFITVRKYNSNETQKYEINDFISLLENNIKTKKFNFN